MKPRDPKTIEWLGGATMMPAYVTDEGDESYYQEALFWLGDDFSILGSTMGKPGDVIALASESLQNTIEHPVSGKPHSPTRVRVASPELAETLRAGHPGIEVVCAPTPEMDEFFDIMFEKIAADGKYDLSYLSSDVAPEAMASLFKAAARLYHAKPWEYVPDNETIFSVTIEELDLFDRVMTVIGQTGQSQGFLLFFDIDGFAAFREAGETFEKGRVPHLPPHLGLNFKPKADFTPQLQQEIAEHEWEIASANAYPLLVAVDTDRVLRPPIGNDVTVLDAITQALCMMMDDKKALQKAWKAREPIARSFTVTTYAGDINITLTTSYFRKPAESHSSDDILAKLAPLTDTEDACSEELRIALEDELMQRFSQSPEAEPFDNIGVCHLIMDLAVTYLGHTIATLDAATLRELVFELIPRKVSIDASKAQWIIEVTRAFYTFLKREYGLEQADACLEVLGGDAVKKLELALSDSGNFGIAKSMVMAGTQTGFDMQSVEGAAAWLQSVKGKALDSPFLFPAFPAPLPLPAAANKARKKKRRDVRKARRKNR